MLIKHEQLLHFTFIILLFVFNIVNILFLIRGFFLSFFFSFF